MFQNYSRFVNLLLHALHRVKHGHDFDGAIECVIEMEALCRTEAQVETLDFLITELTNAFGVNVEDELEYRRG